jgi:DNA end-binding protein Ku
MAARSIWKGTITFDSAKLPVKLYSSALDRSIRFRLLHDQDMVTVKQRMVDPATGKAVAAEDVQRGAEVEPGVFVILEDRDLESIEPPSAREIEVLRFVPGGAISHQWYARPYYLGPDAGGESEYWAFADALDRSGREGIARWVMRKQEYVGALRLHEGYLMLITLRHQGEVIASGDLEPPGGRALSDKELKMAEQLVAALTDEFDPEEFRDEHRDRVLELIEKKARGEKVRLRKPVERKTEGSLTDALSASLAAARRKGKRHG